MPTSVDVYGECHRLPWGKPDSEKVKAICEMSPPENLTELRRLIGMINYLGRFLAELSTAMKTMSDLLMLYGLGVPIEMRHSRNGRTLCAGHLFPLTMTCPKCLERAKGSVWWPEISNEMRNK